MSINFGYGGYGMMNGMNTMGGMQNNTIQSISAQYSCPTCYQQGTIPYNLQTNVNPLPKQAFNHSWISRIFGKIFG